MGKCYQSDQVWEIKKNNEHWIMFRIKGGLNSPVSKSNLLKPPAVLLASGGVTVAIDE